MSRSEPGGRSEEWPTERAQHDPLSIAGGRAKAAVDAPSALDENVEAIREWEQAALHSRSRAERISDAVTRTVSSGPFIALHLLWFLGWGAANEGLISWIEPFDAFPFPLLTMTVSLEAIFLTLFVLASQNRFASQSDKRAHLDLQVNLLAEREMTAVLRLLQDIATHLNVRRTLTQDQIDDLSKHTDIHRLTNDADDMAEQAETPDDSH